jgi:uncharacterized membrane protein
MENNIKKAADKVIGSILYPGTYSNIEDSERIVSAAFGAFMFWKGVSDIFSKPSNAVWELVLGGALIYRGATGYCAVKQKMESYCPIEKKQKGDTEFIVESM